MPSYPRDRKLVAIVSWMLCCHCSKARNGLVVLVSLALLVMLLHPLYTPSVTKWGIAPRQQRQLRMKHGLDSWSEMIEHHEEMDPPPGSVGQSSEVSELLNENAFIKDEPFSAQRHVSKQEVWNIAAFKKYKKKMSNNSSSTSRQFKSPLIVASSEFPSKYNLAPIPRSAALGVSSSLLTPSQQKRPVTVAYIYSCDEIQEEPYCLVDETMEGYEEKCPYPGLQLIKDWKRADIVVFNVWRFRSQRYIPDFNRPPGQIWVMMSTEAALRKKNHLMLEFPKIKGQFNLTMSYRLDSDIPYPYGYLQRRTVIKNRDFDAVYAAKRHMAAWLVSHCQTNGGREHYTRRLIDAGLKVHVYGKCGDYSCFGGRSKTRNSARTPDKVCYPRISKNYFFYFSFENTLCRDYVTEKLFKMYTNIDVIPIVRGGADYKRLFPPGTYIDVDDFRNEKELVRYLNQLANDKERYLGMLRNKASWRSLPRPSWYCALGEKLASGTLRPRVIRDVRAWLTKDQCWSPYGTNEEIED